MLLILKMAEKEMTSGSNEGAEILTSGKTKKCQLLLQNYLIRTRSDPNPI